MENLNAENIKNEIQSLIKALKDCGGWVKRGNGEGWFNHEILADALALINSQEQRIKELNDKNEGLKAENALLINMHVVDDHGVEMMRMKINLPDPLKSSGEEYVVNRQETIKPLIQKNEQLTEENERLKAEVADLQDELKCEKETNAHLCSQYMSENHLRHQAEEMLANGMSVVKADTVRKMQERFKTEIERFAVPKFTSKTKNPNFITKDVCIWFIDQTAKEILEEDK